MTTASLPSTAFRARRGWLLFIVLSLLIHLSAILLWQLFHPQHLAREEDSAAPFAVQIVTAPPSPHAPVPPRTEPAVARKAPDTASRPDVTRQATVSLAGKPAEAAEQPAVANPERSEIDDAGSSLLLPEIFHDGDEQSAPAQSHPDSESRLQIESLIRTRFADYFVYPRLAQGHGWQGEVVLSFRVGRDGSITHIEVVRSSGHAILDEAALDSMRHIERIEFAPGLVLHHMLELRMPVIYHLAQG